MSDVDILNDRELDALASSSGDDVDMASVKCVVREVRDLRARLAAMEVVVEAAMSYGDRMDFACSRAAGEMYTCERQLMEAIDAYRAAKAKEQT